MLPIVLFSKGLTSGPITLRWLASNLLRGSSDSPMIPSSVRSSDGRSSHQQISFETGPIALFWSDPLGGSANDYDLFRMNAAGTTVIASSTNIQSGTQDPTDQMASQSTANPRLVVVKKAAAAARYLHLNTNRGRLATATAGQTHGHNSTSAPYSFGVAAAATAAAIAGLFKSQNPSFTQAQLKTLLLSTALDIEAPGVDRDSGAGIVMAVAPRRSCVLAGTLARSLSWSNLITARRWRRDGMKLKSGILASP